MNPLVSHFSKLVLTSLSTNGVEEKRSFYKVKLSNPAPPSWSPSHMHKLQSQDNVEWHRYLNATLNNLTVDKQKQKPIIHYEKDKTILNCLKNTPILDYASETWSGQSLNITSAIERVQRRATNYILGIPSRTVPYKERLSRTNLLPLTYWHEIKDLLFIHGCLNGKYNINIERFVKFAPETNHRSWCHNNFVIPRSRTKHFQQSFFIRSCRLWNSLPKRNLN